MEKPSSENELGVPIGIEPDMLDHLISVVTACTRQLATVNEGLER